MASANESQLEEDFQVQDITHLYFLVTDPTKEVHNLEHEDTADLKFRQFKNYRDFIQRDKIEVKHKVAMMRQNTSLMAKDPAKERKEYWFSIIGPERREAYLSIYDKGRKAIDKMKFREWDIHLAMKDLREFMGIQEKDPQIPKMINVIKVIMRQEPFFTYRPIWSILAATMVKTYDDEQTAFFFTYFILKEVMPANWFRSEFRQACKGVYARILGTMINFMFPDFQGYLSMDTTQDGVTTQNQEAYQHLLYYLIENTVEQFFQTSNKNGASFMRMLDYMMIYRYALLFKLAVKSVDLLREEIKSLISNKTNAKQMNVASLIYAVTHVKPLFQSTKVNCATMLKYVDNILANNLYSDLVQYQYNSAASRAVTEEYKEKLEISSRMTQIKRVIGLLHLMQQGITKQNLQTILDILTNKSSPTRTLSSLTSLLKSNSKTECLLNKNAIQYIMALCPSAMADKVFDLEFQFMLILLSKTKSDLKVSQLMLLFANKILEKQGKLNEEGKLLQHFDKTLVQEVLYQYENCFDPRLNYYNKGSTVMHICKDKLTRIEFVRYIMAEEQGFYLYQLVLVVNGKKLEIDQPVYQTCHFMSHYQFLKSKHGNQQQVQQRAVEKVEQVKKGTEIDRRAQILNKYRSQGLQLRKDEKLTARSEDEEEDSKFDKRRVYANKKVKVDQFGKYLQFDEDKEKYGMVLLTIEDDQRERYDTSFFEDCTDNYIRNPIKKLGQIFSFTGNTMQTQQDTIFEMDEDMPIGNVAMPTGTTQVDHKVDPTKATYMDREKEEETLYQMIGREFEESMVDVLAAKDHYLRVLYDHIYIDSLVKVIEKNDVDVNKKEMNLQIEIESEVSQHSFALSANQEDLEVFVYGMAKKDAMVDASAIVLKEELLEDDREQLADEQRRRDQQRLMLEEESKNALQAEQKRLREQFEAQQTKMREKMDRELKYIRDEFAQKQKEQDDFFERERELMEKKQDELQREAERLLRAEEKRMVKEENFRKMKEREKEEERLRKIAEEEERHRLAEEERLRKEFEAQPEQQKKRAMEEMIANREAEKEALKAEAELEEIDPQEVMAARVNPDSKKIHEWENSSEDLETDNLVKKKRKKEIEAEKREAELQESMRQSRRSGGSMKSSRSKAKSKARSKGSKSKNKKKFLSSESEENLDELPPAIRVQRQCTNVVVNGYQYLVDLFQGPPKKKKSTTKKGKGKSDNESKSQAKTTKRKKKK